MLIWAVQDGGYDTSTWYWGALLLLATAVGVLLLRRDSLNLSRTTRRALTAFALYVAWSYLSIAWAGSKGDALDGSNRALMYLLMFTLVVALPWTTRAALIALTTFALGIGGIGVVLLARLSSGDHVGSLIAGGRLAAPTGYINATAALFTVAALVAIALAARRELPNEIRGALIAAACAGLQLAVIVQSRGWLFTLPLVAIVAILIVPDRLRVAAAAALPVIGTLLPISRLLHIYSATPGRLAHASGRAGTVALIICAVLLALGTVIAWAERRFNPRPLSAQARRRLGVTLAAIAVAGFVGGGIAATHGHPFAFIRRQWNGFSHPTTNPSAQSHFGDVGSGRYDFWRVSLDALISHPIGGLGQDNFDDYYVLHRRTSQEPAWTHSLEMRLLAHTGLVGFLLFGAFMVLALRTAWRTVRNSGALGAAVAGAALLPLVDWLIHGSVDWFWEMPALSGPALGFLGVAIALGERRVVLWRREPDPASLASRPARLVALRAAAVMIVVLLVLVLGFPYLSARETAQANAIAATDPASALSDLSTAADLDPLSAYPGRLAGTIALQSGDFTIAEARFAQVISRERGGWFGWFGEGLAASALGQQARARRLLTMAERINPRQPIIARTLGRLDSANPVTPREGLAGIEITH